MTAVYIIVFVVFLAFIYGIVYMTKSSKEDREKEQLAAQKAFEEKVSHIKETHIIGQSSQKNASSAVGRAVVGDILGGGAGAVVGASTAKNDEIITFLIIYDNGKRETDQAKYGDEKYNIYIQYLKV